MPTLWPLPPSRRLPAGAQTFAHILTSSAFDRLGGGITSTRRLALVSVLRRRASACALAAAFLLRRQRKKRQEPRPRSEGRNKRGERSGPPPRPKAAERAEVNGKRANPRDTSSHLSFNQRNEMKQLRWHPRRSRPRRRDQNTTITEAGNTLPPSLLLFLIYLESSFHLAIIIHLCMLISRKAK